MIYTPILKPESELYRDTELNDEVYSNLQMAINDQYIEKIKDGSMLASRIVECSIFNYDKNTFKVFVVLEDFEGESYQCSLKSLFNYCEYLASDFNVNLDDVVDGIKQLVYTKICNDYDLNYDSLNLYLDNKKNELINKPTSPVQYKSGQKAVEFWD